MTRRTTTRRAVAQDQDTTLAPTKTTRRINNPTRSTTAEKLTTNKSSTRLRIPSVKPDKKERTPNTFKRKHGFNRASVESAPSPGRPSANTKTEGSGGRDWEAAPPAWLETVPLLAVLIVNHIQARPALSLPGSLTSQERQVGRRISQLVARSLDTFDRSLAGLHGGQ